MKEVLPSNYNGKLFASNEVHLEWMFNKFWNKLVYCSMKITNDQLVSEDIVSEKFIHISSNNFEFINHKKAEAAIWIIVKNASLDFLGNKKVLHKKNNKYSYCIEKSECLFDANSESTKNKVFINELWIIIKSIMRPRHYDIIKSRFLDGLSINEVATKYNLTYNGIKSRTGEAMRKLRGSIELKKLREKYD